MNAVEKIEAAVAKLEKQRARGSDGPWKRDDFATIGGVSAVSNDVGGFVAHHLAEPDADLIVTLHRTIDAQLAILRAAVKGREAAAHAVQVVNDGGGDDITVEQIMSALDTSALALAEAILGGDS